MRRQKSESDQPHLNFKNTRSKFYKRKSEEIDDYGQENNKQESEKSTGNYWKQQGNIQFRKGNIEKAIEYYSKAIEKTPSESIYFCNRAKSYKKLRRFKQALRDAQQACQLDPGSIKANYICGCILAELGKDESSKLSKAQNRLKKALRLCSSFKKQQFEQQISIKFYRLKKLMWYIDKNQQLNDLNAEKNILNQKITDSSTYKRILNRIQNRIKQIQQFVRSKQIPDHLCCKITLQLMEQPTITQQGLTYEKSALQDHFKTNGFVEPISRKKLTTKPFPNLALKIAIQNFLDQNPWAFQVGFQDNYLQIQF